MINPEDVKNTVDEANAGKEQPTETDYLSPTRQLRGDQPDFDEEDIALMERIWDYIAEQGLAQSAARRRNRQPSELSPAKQQLQRFWTAFCKRLEENAPHIHPQSIRPLPYIEFSTGSTSFNFLSVALTEEQRIGVEVWLMSSQAEQHFYTLYAQKEQIESDLGFALDWKDSPDGRSFGVTSCFHGATLEDEHRWEEYFDWLTHRIVKMEEVLLPILKDLP